MNRMKIVKFCALSAVITLTPITANAATISSAPKTVQMQVNSNYVRQTGSIVRGGVATYNFTAPTTGKYTIQLFNSTFNANGKVKDITTGSSYQANDQPGNNFKIYQDMNAGDQYTVTVWGVKASDYGTFSLRITVPD
ncbi:hypothetical protein [Clostridium hydrogenum]|uniref:hypothetical protein n=1 Tax=Clostridium hydrogenum TaxID=2855764 RepID=UPI001F3326C5|nr:hypothetical protein [Clostridium hydrogenum]